MIVALAVAPWGCLMGFGKFEAANAGEGTASPALPMNLSQAGLGGDPFHPPA